MDHLEKKKNYYHHSRQYKQTVEEFFGDKAEHFAMDYSSEVRLLILEIVVSLIVIIGDNKLNDKKNYSVLISISGPATDGCW